MAVQIVRGLRAIGADVWWDEDMPGVDWQLELDRQIHELGCVVVLWTPSSINSRHVRDEARLADSQQKLINALDGVTKPSFPFDRVNGLPLDGWNGQEPHNGWDRLVKTVEDYLVKVGSIQPGELTAALDKFERDTRRKQSAVERAEEAYQQAKALEDEAETAVVEAQAALQASEAQLRRVSELQASSRLLLAAQADFDECRNTKAEADKNRRAAAATLATASRALTRARNDMARMFTESDDTSLGPRPDTEGGAGEVDPPGPEKPLDLSQSEVVEPAPVEPVKPEPPKPELDDDLRKPPLLGPTPTPPPAPPPPPPKTDPVKLKSDPGKTTVSPLRRLAPAAVLAGILVVALIGVVVMFSHSSPKPFQGNTIDTNAADANSSDANTAPAANTAPPAADVHPSAIGAWSGNGSTCINPLKLRIAAGSAHGGQAISMTMMDSVTTGAVQEVQPDGTVVAQMTDGVWTYRADGATLNVTAPGGAKLSYSRCVDF
jgi:hypothetical protein